MGLQYIMIKSFSHKGLEKFFYDGTKKGIQATLAKRLGLILDYLDAAEYIRDMNFPGLDLHALRGRKKGYWSVKVSGNWRIVFRFDDANAHDVDYLDYH